MKNRALFIILFGAMLALIPATAFGLSSKDVEKELMCQCGCTMTVDVCDCETANQIREKISEMMTQGQDKGQMIAYFVGQYGEKMLASPAKKGFNLIAWIVPFAAVLVGGTGLFFILRVWTRKGRRTNEEIPVMVHPVSVEDAAEYQGRLEAELRKFKEEG